MKNTPNTIYLNLFLENQDEDDFKNLSEVTWSKDELNSSDLKYVSRKSVEKIVSSDHSAYAKINMLRELINK